MIESKQNPFSIYDFLGYLIPGAIFLYGILFIFGHSQTELVFPNYLKEFLSLDKPDKYIPFILLAYVLGHFLNLLSSITIERYSIWVLGYPSKYLLLDETPEYFQVEDPKVLRYAVRIFIFIIILPVSFLDVIFGKLLKMRELYAKGLDKLLRAALWIKILKLIKMHAGIENPDNFGKPNEHDFFRYVYHYALENAPNHFAKMQNYVALYGFLRTLTFISTIFFWCFLYHFFKGSLSNLVNFILISCSALISYTFFIGFVKFYRRFSLEALMAMAIAFEPNHS